MKQFLILHFFILHSLFGVHYSFSQTLKIDSLQNILKTTKEDTNKSNILNALSWELLNQGDYEKAMLYAMEVLALCNQFLPINNKQSSIINIKKATAYNNIGNIYNQQGNHYKALENHFASLKLIPRGSEGTPQWTIIAANAYGNIGNIYADQGNYDKALEHYFASLKIREKIGDKKGIAASYNNIGLIYKEQGNYDKALENYFASLKIKEEIGDKKGIAASYNNIGLIYKEQGNYDNGLKNCFASLKIREEIGDKKGIAASYNNIGNIYADQGKYVKALENYFLSLKKCEEIGDKNGMASSYNNLGILNTDLKKYAEAENWLSKGLALSKEIGTKQWTKDAYGGLSQLDSVQGKWKGAYEYQKLYSEIKDSIFNEESSKQMHEMSTKYETEKKEQQIKLLNKDKEIQTKDLQRQKTIRNAVAGFLLLVIGFLFVLINRFVLIRKQKKVIETEREKSEKLLLNILPKATADELKLHNKVIPKSYEMVTVMFTDFKGFTTLAEKMSAEELVNELDFIFRKFDEIISKYSIEKIKTIGDSYMCAGGLPVANSTNPIDVVMAGLEIQAWMKTQNKWQLRLGVHTGSVIAGVVGDKKFAYDIWGDAVNTASRMESSGEAGKVNISGETYKFLVETDNCRSLQFVFRGKIPAKNKGEVEMYFVEMN